MIEIDFENQTAYKKEEAWLPLMRRYIEKTLKTEGIDLDLNAYEVSLTWVEPDTIHKLNAEYRQVDRETDVLSFPMYNFPEDEAVLEAPSEIPVLLGDIVLNPARAAEQGEKYGTGFKREMCYLTVHSTLHLLGYDHMEPADKQKMRAREKAIIGDVDAPQPI
ncbi:MAG: rRNA maturation RNase YbeY [Pseudoramibacter sp.]